MDSFLEFKYGCTGCFGQETDLFVIEFLNAMGDLLDLTQAVKDRTKRSQPMNMTRQMLNDYIARNSRCSALIKATTINSSLNISLSSISLHYNYSPFHFIVA